MSVDALLATLESRGAVTPVAPLHADGVTAKALLINVGTPVTPVTPPSDDTQGNPTKSDRCAATKACRRWRVHFPNLNPVEVIFEPEATRDEVADLYPGAEISPLPASPRRHATPAEATELRALAEVVLADAPAEWAEIHRMACADLEAALDTFRGIAAECRMNVPQ